MEEQESIWLCAGSATVIWVLFELIEYQQKFYARKYQVSSE